MAVAITQTANPAGVATSSSVATYSGVSTGTASADRVIVVAMGKEVAGVVIQSATIDGNAMTFHTGSSTFGSVSAAVCWRAWPTGTTADIAVTFNGAAADTENHIAVYAITGAKFPPKSSGGNTSTDMDASTPLTTGSITIPTNGGFIACAVGATDTVAKTWANATVDIEADAGVFRFTTAKSTTGGTVTVTCTGGTNNEDGGMAWFILEPEEIPPLVMAPSRA